MRKSTARPISPLPMKMNVSSIQTPSRGSAHSRPSRTEADSSTAAQSTIPSSKRPPTLTSTVTTLASIVLCIPSNNLVAVPSPTCAGRKKREIEDSEDNHSPSLHRKRSSKSIHFHFYKQHFKSVFLIGLVADWSRRLFRYWMGSEKPVKRPSSIRV